MANDMNPVGWFEIYVSDMGRSKAFYEAVLGETLVKLPTSGESHDDMLAFPMQQGRSGASGALVRMEGAPIGAGGTIVYFVTDDCGAAAGRARNAGGTIVKDKFSIGDYGNIALVSDLDGNIVGFHSMT
jgi:predicted enzyme related to lactoylglutathione lyase